MVRRIPFVASRCLPDSAVAAAGEYHLAAASPLDGVKVRFWGSDTKGRMMHLFTKKEKKRLSLTKNQPAHQGAVILLPSFTSPAPETETHTQRRYPPTNPPPPPRALGHEYASLPSLPPVPLSLPSPALPHRMLRRCGRGQSRPSSRGSKRSAWCRCRDGDGRAGRWRRRGRREAG